MNPIFERPPCKSRNDVKEGDYVVRVAGTPQGESPRFT